MEPQREDTTGDAEYARSFMEPQAEDTTGDAEYARRLRAQWDSEDQRSEQPHPMRGSHL
jgi:hypothetical protein